MGSFGGKRAAAFASYHTTPTPVPLSGIFTTNQQGTGQLAGSSTSAKIDPHYLEAELFAHRRPPHHLLGGGHASTARADEALFVQQDLQGSQQQ